MVAPRAYLPIACMVNNAKYKFFIEGCCLAKFPQVLCNVHAQRVKLAMHITQNSVDFSRIVEQSNVNGGVPFAVVRKREGLRMLDFKMPDSFFPLENRLLPE